MAGFKRGGARGGGGSTFKKGYAKKRSSPDDDDSAPRATKKTKGDEEEEEGGQAVEPTLAKDDEGNDYIGLNASGKRRVTVSEFKNNTLISIREYWTNDSGELKPGKKGISLTVDQYQTLLASAPLLESVLAKKGIQLARPDYNADLDVNEEEDDVKDTVKKVDESDEEDDEQ
ncbi:PC4-domain-containing protein [Plenodomus tracheiphilus IPT5]|uniref:PC4-domain-containing protein n=1 Tax=Plenodomus tracheiphilus IPT5 TaxID=1408161 RepID=A0A6A7AX94_9PLEO|nr:PC4-domain-containing protein [Plenodomus tracheiphilus IPT5]